MHASMTGGPEHYGWGRDRHMTADMIDIAIAAAMGQGGKKFKQDRHGYKRPQVKSAPRQGRSLTSFIPRMKRAVSDGG